MRALLCIVAAFGVLLFGALFAATYATPDAVERAAKDFVRYQVEKKVAEKLNDQRLAPFKTAAAVLADKYQIDIDQLQIDLKSELPKKIAAVIAALCRLDCAAQRNWQAAIATGYQKEIGVLTFARDRLAQLIADRYHDIVQDLTRDVRIFLGSNAVLFALVLLLAVVRRDAQLHLLLPAGVLLLATLIGSAIYLLGQNWFFTIVYSDYTGYLYLGYVAALFALLLDLIWNRGRITTEIINGILNMLGSAASVLPCG